MLTICSYVLSTMVCWYGLQVKTVWPIIEGHFSSFVYNLHSIWVLPFWTQTEKWNNVSNSYLVRTISGPLANMTWDCCLRGWKVSYSLVLLRQTQRSYWTHIQTDFTTRMIVAGAVINTFFKKLICLEQLYSNTPLMVIYIFKLSFVGCNVLLIAFAVFYEVDLLYFKIWKIFYLRISNLWKDLRLLS